MVAITPPPELEVHETSIAGEGLGAVFKHKGEIAAVRYVGFSAYEIAADVEEDGSITLQISGPPSIGEDNALPTATRLIDWLNREAEVRGPPVDVSRQSSATEGGVDCVATAGDGRKLLIQVSRADATTALWRALSEAGCIRGRYVPTELAEIIWQAIARKKHRSAPGIVLALDAGLLVSHSLTVVVDALRAAHGEDLSGLGFAGTYLVGPTAALVWQLTP